MLDALRVSKNIYSVSLIQPTVSAILKRLVGQLWVDFSSRLQEEDVCAGVLRTQVNVAKNTGPYRYFGSIEDQVRIDIHNSRFLQTVRDSCTTEAQA